MDALTLIVETFDPIAGRMLLDIGCGRGQLAKVLGEHGACVTGVDPLAEAIAGAESLAPGARFEIASAESLPFDDGAFDGAVLLNALHHVPDPGAALREAARVTRPGGCIVVIEPLAEGSFFAALRTLEDETTVRDAAQRAIAASGLPCFRETVFERRERFATLDAFLDRVVAVDPARAAAARRARADIEAAFVHEAERDDDDGYVLVQPLRAHVLTADRRSP